VAGQIDRPGGEEEARRRQGRKRKRKTWLRREKTKGTR